MAIFELVENTKNQIILKVNTNNNLDIARNPFIDRTYDYITVTKGKSHILTVIKKDGTTFSFDWGEEGYTLISNNLTRLKNSVIDFIEDKNHILLDRRGWDIARAAIYHNPNYGEWQLTIEGNGARENAIWLSKTANSYDDMVREVRNYITCDKWIPEKAVTGIDIWRAVL